MSASLASGLFPARLPEATALTYWVLGAVTTVLLFGSVLLHELGHAFEALRHRLPVRRITLFIFGGVAELYRGHAQPAGRVPHRHRRPDRQLALAAGFYATWLLSRDLTRLPGDTGHLAGTVNLMLALFNLIPGFPLDGGRVLRAAVWAWSGSQARATRYASIGGQTAAAGFMGLARIALFGGDVSQRNLAALHRLVSLQRRLVGHGAGSCAQPAGAAYASSRCFSPATLVSHAI